MRALPPRRGLAFRAGIAAALGAAAGAALPGCSCGDGGGARDAGPGGDGGILRDAGVESDAAMPLIWIDFSVTGCRPGDGSSPGGGGRDAGTGEPGADAGPDGGACAGSAPLELTFVPIAPAAVDFYEWSFGDGSEPDHRPAPEHVYNAPGAYDVSLFAQGPGGTAAATRRGLVVVGPGALGNACSEDSQCASGRCICGAEPCAGLASGFCSADCSADAPCGDGVCADLAPTPLADPAPWQAELCLSDCAAAGACPDGLACRELLAAGGAGWVLGCFAPGLLGGAGDSCADGSGALQDALCASGECLAEGLRGVCSAPCAAGGCPPSAACASFRGGAPGPSCLARCDEDTACDADPWLACEPAGGDGAKAFTVDEAPSADGYCAPKPCEGPDDCPQGRCANGFCGP